MWDGIWKGQTSDPGVAASREIFEANMYGYFSFWHVVSIAIAFFIIGIIWILSFRKKQYEETVIKIASCIVVFCMLSLITYSLITGIYNIEWYVPFHICNLFFIILPLSVFSKKVRKFSNNYFVFFGIGGGFLQIIFPINTSIYLPVFHPVSTIVWIHHITIASLGGYYIMSGLFKKFNAFPMLAYLTYLVVSAAICNYYTGANFLFFNPARRVFPITALCFLFGDYAVFIVIALIYVIGIAIHLVCRYFYRRKEKTIRQLICENWFIKRIVISSDIQDYIESIKGNLKSSVAAIKKHSEIDDGLKKVIGISERFVNCVKESNILKKLFDTKLADITDIDYLVDTFNDSGLIKSLVSEFKMSELKQFKDIPCEEVYLLPGRGYVPLLNPASI